VTADPFTADVSRHVWDTKYRYRLGEQVVDHSVEDTWRRVARTVASVEPQQREAWEQRFLGVLSDFRFLPGGRILAGAGTEHRVTLFNCFVMGVVQDSMDGIFEGLKEAALTMQQGGGVGYDFSTLRPAGSHAMAAGTIASGPVSFMRVWDATCATLLSTGARRGAMMATLRCDHPDVERFVAAKRTPGELTNFNVSVQVTDAFMEAVRRGADWPLVFPAEHLAETDAPSGPMVLRRWTGCAEPVPCRVLRVVPARQLWDLVMRSTYDHAEPGVLFVDRVNRTNNLWYREHLTATNPCGEIPLPPYGACDLGSVNLTRFVVRPFTPEAALDRAAFAETVAVAVRFLDDVIDASRFPLPRQEQEAHATRRVGLGVTGLADTLVMLGLHYASPEGLALAGGLMELLCHTAYRTSVALAREKGSFPALCRDRHLEGEFVRSLPEDVRAGIAEHGVRNSHLVAVAPTGTISLLANNVSSGVEPVYDLRYRRRMLERDGTTREFELTDHAYALWRELRGAEPPPRGVFVTAHELLPEQHLAMQAALQPFVDNAISKTVNVAEDFPFENFRGLYELAHHHGLKGCTTFRKSPVRGAVLGPAAVSGAAAGSATPPAHDALPDAHCCTLEREAD
jgi:ribonucleoside-diphosphate reductase alpha chain